MKINYSQFITDLMNNKFSEEEMLCIIVNTEEWQFWIHPDFFPDILKITYTDFYNKYKVLMW